MWIFFPILQHRKTADSMLVGCSSRSPDAEGSTSPKYSDRLSPAINAYLSEASRQEVRVWLLIFGASLLNIKGHDAITFATSYKPWPFCEFCMSLKLVENGNNSDLMLHNDFAICEVTCFIELPACLHLSLYLHSGIHIFWPNHVQSSNSLAFHLLILLPIFISELLDL